MPDSVSFDRAADFYDATRIHPPEVGARIAEALITAGRIPPGGHVLEIGVGTGRIALPLLARGVHLSGVDISPRMLDRLQAKYDEGRRSAVVAWGALDARVADMTALPFADGRFDAVVAVHVLHLTTAWRRALDEALRVLAPGGRLLLGQDVSNSDAVGIRVQDRWLRIISSMGHDPARPGAASQAVILDELRRRGLRAEVRDVASWQMSTTPRAAIDDIARRMWSRTWDVPDDLLSVSVRELTRDVEQQYRGQMDIPQAATYSFRLAVVLPHAER